MSLFSSLTAFLPRMGFRFYFSPATFLILFLNIALAQAGEVVTRWSPNLEANIKGYRVYYGPASRYYLHWIDVGLATSCTITNLEEGKTYYFAATAYDESGFESDYSAEGVYQVPVKYAIQPSSRSFQASGGEGTVQVIAPAEGTWKAQSNVPWVSITSSPAGIGRGTVSYAVQANPANSPRKETLTIAGLAFTVSQDGQPLPLDPYLP